MIFNIFLLGMPSVGSWVIIALALLLFFGGKKIPELMKGLGGGIKEFKKASKDDKKEDEKIEELKSNLLKNNSSNSIQNKNSKKALLN